MKITPTQAAILEHRLSAGTIPEVFADSEPPVPISETEKAVVEVEGFIALRFLPFETMTKLELEVIIDCLDGSTFFGGGGAEDAVAEGTLSRSKLQRWHKAADELEEMVSKAAGHPVRCASR